MPYECHRCKKRFPWPPTYIPEEVLGESQVELADASSVYSLCRPCLIWTLEEAARKLKEVGA